jgi:hypothetical protein
MASFNTTTNPNDYLIKNKNPLVSMSDKVKLNKATNIDYNIAMFGFNNNASNLA